MRQSVCIFARNEERLLPYCVAALSAAGLAVAARIFILINGCTDGTAQVARTLATADPRIEVRELPVGDKASAWNDYVHRFADPDTPCHVFLDGDVKPSAGAVAALEAALSGSPAAYGAAALPAAGRSRRGWAKQLLLNHYISGNLYALSGRAIAAFREASLHLPYGAKGEDGIITYLLLTDLKGGRDDTHRERIVVAEDATFEFESLRPRLDDARIYYRRLRRYSERHFQKQILYALLKEHGAGAMPQSIYDIYTPERLAALTPRRDPANYLIDRETLKRLRAGGGRPPYHTA